MAVPLHRVLYSRRATVSTGNVRFTRYVHVPCCGCTIAQSARVMYVLPVLYSCRAVAVPLHRVFYSRRAIVSTGNVRFIRFVLVPCCGCTIAPCVGNVPFTRFCTRAVRARLHSASTDRVLIGRVRTRAVTVPLHGVYRACTVISSHSCWTSGSLKGSAIPFLGLGVDITVCCCTSQPTNTVPCMVAASGLYGTLSYGRVVQTSECCWYVRGVVVRAHSLCHLFAWVVQSCHLLCAHVL